MRLPTLVYQFRCCINPYIYSSACSCCIVVCICAQTPCHQSLVSDCPPGQPLAMQEDLVGVVVSATSEVDPGMSNLDNLSSADIGLVNRAVDEQITQMSLNQMIQG